MHNTIVAPVTAPGEAGVAIIRASGKGCRELLPKICTCGKKALRSPRRLCLGRIIHNEKVIDEAMAVFMPAPHSYTCEDVFELQLHGGRAVVEETLKALLNLGARMAEPGEFTRRAFENGRIDLTRAEAVMELINAHTEQAARQAAEQLEGRLGKVLDEIRGDTISLLAEVEAALDYPEEDLGAPPEMMQPLKELTLRLDRLIESYDAGRLRREGLRVALLGAPNAGKSTLFNALLGRERAIVTDVAGTTRDTLEEEVQLCGISIRLMDTAGLREEAGTVEKIGIERAMDAARGADLVLRVVDGAGGIAPEAPEGVQCLTVYNKADLPGFTAQEGAIAISSLTGEGLDELKGEMEKLLRPALKEGVFVSSARHYRCLTRARDALIAAQQAIEMGFEADCVAVSIRDMLACVDEMTGAQAAPEVIDEIFSKFCLGK